MSVQNPVMANPALFDVVRGSAASRTALVAAALLIAFAASLPFWGESSWMREFVEIACYLIFAMMWNLLAGYGGMVSIGQQAFFGFGGYVMLMLGNFAGVNPFIAVPLGALAAAAIAVPVSFVAFRLSGGYFAIGTWVIAEVFRLSFANVSAVGGGSGTTLTALRGIERATRESATYWMALACVVAAIALVYVFLRSKRGLALLAIRDNEVAAESQGIPVGRIEGPLVGALIFWALNKFFSDYGTWYLLGLGLLAIVVTIFFKQGLWGYAQQRWGWSLFPTQRRLVGGGVLR
jgi:branched-chain amino acid transport system permease protein